MANPTISDRAAALRIRLDDLTIGHALVASLAPAGSLMAGERDGAAWEQTWEQGWEQTWIDPNDRH